MNIELTRYQIIRILVILDFYSMFGKKSPHIERIKKKLNKELKKNV